LVTLFHVIGVHLSPTYQKKKGVFTWAQSPCVIECVSFWSMQHKIRVLHTPFPAQVQLDESQNLK